MEETKMSFANILITLIEISVGGIIIWGFWHEDAFLKFEDKLFAKLGFKVKKHTSAKITKFESGVARSKNCI